MKQIIWTFLLTIFFSIAIYPQKIESIYNDLTEKNCKTIESTEKGDTWYRGECQGIADYKLEVIYGDARMTLNVIAPNGKKSELELWTNVSSAFSELGLKAEWRVIRNGKKVRPIALIVRFDASEDIRNQTEIGFHKTTSRLIVIKILNDSACLTNIVQPSKNQNVKARQLADKAVEKPCLELTGK